MLGNIHHKHLISSKLHLSPYVLEGGPSSFCLFSSISPELLMWNQHSSVDLLAASAPEMESLRLQHAESLKFRLAKRTEKDDSNRGPVEISLTTNLPDRTDVSTHCPHWTVTSNKQYAPSTHRVRSEGELRKNIEREDEKGRTGSHG